MDGKKLKQRATPLSLSLTIAKILTEQMREPLPKEKQEVAAHNSLSTYI